jgi:hypothetical protein
MIAIATLVWCAIARAGIVVPCIPGHEYSTEELRAMLPEGDIAFTHSEIAPVLEELMPVVERASGKAFKRPPNVKIVNRNTLMAAIFADRIRACAALDPLADPKQVEKQWTVPMLAYAAPSSITAIARYIERDQTIMVAPRNLETTKKFLRAFDSTTRDVLRAVLAHELVRALHSQHGLGAQANDDIEALYVAGCVSEAHAWVVGEAALRTLPDSRPAIEARSVLARPPLRSDDVRVHRYLRNENHAISMLHSTGIPFMERRYGALGPDACWEVLAARPDRWLDPDRALTWQPPDRTWPGIRAFFEPMRAALGDALPRRQSAAQEPGQIARSMEELLGPIRAPEGNRSIVRFATAIAVDDAGTKALSCMAMQVRSHHDIAWAKEFLREQEAAQRELFEEGGFDAVATGPVPIEVRDADWAERSETTVKQDERTAVSTRWRAGRGTVMVEINRSGQALADESVLALLQSMIDACAPAPALPDPVPNPPGE